MSYWSSGTFFRVHDVNKLEVGGWGRFEKLIGDHSKGWYYKGKFFKVYWTRDIIHPKSMTEESVYYK